MRPMAPRQSRWSSTCRVQTPSKRREIVPGKKLAFRRYLAATDTGLHEALIAAHGEAYAQALIDGDPEIDIEQVGKYISDTSPVFLSASGEVLHVSPNLTDVIFGPDGSERERKEAANTPGNVNDDTPVRWTGRKLPRSQAITRFAFRRTGHGCSP